MITSTAVETHWKWSNKEGEIGCVTIPLHLEQISGLASQFVEEVLTQKIPVVRTQEPLAALRDICKDYEPVCFLLAHDYREIALLHSADLKAIATIRRVAATFAIAGILIGIFLGIYVSWMYSDPLSFYLGASREYMGIRHDSLGYMLIFLILFAIPLFGSLGLGFFSNEKISLSKYKHLWSERRIVQVPEELADACRRVEIARVAEATAESEAEANSKLSGTIASGATQLGSTALGYGKIGTVLGHIFGFVATNYAKKRSEDTPKAKENETDRE